MNKNFPWATVAVLGILVTALVVLSLVSNTNSATLIPVLAGLIPGILAAGYAERTNRDVRNGVVQQKAKEGATEALTETGVTAVVANAAAQTQGYVDTLNAHTAALSQLLSAHESANLTPKEGA